MKGIESRAHRTYELLKMIGSNTMQKHQKLKFNIFRWTENPNFSNYWISIEVIILVSKVYFNCGYKFVKTRQGNKFTIGKPLPLLS